MFAGTPFCELAIAVRLQTAELCLVIPGGGRIFHKICKGTFSMSAQRFCKNQPSLGLGKNTGILFCSLIIDDGQGAVEGVGMVGRIHQEGAVFGV